MLAVIDTNVLVSGLWSPGGPPNDILSQVLTGIITLCYDVRIIEEYDDVLRRDKFQFEKADVDALIDFIMQNGMSVVPVPLTDIKMKDEDDRPFFEVAKFCNCPLVTGNTKDYPKDDIVIAPSDFMLMCNVK